MEALNQTTNKLRKIFYVFSNDLEYYNSLVSDAVNMELDPSFENLKELIISQITENWQKGDYKWVIDYLKKGAINSKKISVILEVLEICELQIDISTLEKMLEECSKLEKYLSSLFPGSSVSDAQIEKISPDENFQGLLYAYAGLKNIEIMEMAEIDEYDDDTISNGFSDDITRQYFTEVCAKPLLAPEVTIGFFKEIEEIDEQLNNSKISDAEKKKLNSKKERLKERILEGNLRLVINIAKRYVGRGLDLLDLIQEGNLGLLYAIEKFEVSKGFKFSTYATYWIRQKVARSTADLGRTIRIPVHVYESINKFRKEVQSLELEIGRTPTLYEISEKTEYSLEQVEKFLLYLQEPTSINQKIGEDEDTEMGDMLVDDKGKSPVEEALLTSLRDSMNAVVGVLNSREEYILRMRYGIQNPENYNKNFETNHTLEEVGAVLHVTRERIRQLETKAIKKLRQPRNAKKIKDFSDIEDEKEEPIHSYVKTIFDKGNNIPKEELTTVINSFIQNAIPELTKQEETIIRMFFGIQSPTDPEERFEIAHDLPELNKLLYHYRFSPSHLMNSAIKKINAGYVSSLKLIQPKVGGDNMNSFKSKFKAEEFELAKEKIVLLNPAEQEALYKYYGKELDIVNSKCDSHTISVAFNAVEKIQRMLKDPSYEESLKQKKRSPRNSGMIIVKPSVDPKNLISLEMILGCSIEEVFAVVKVLDDHEKNILKEYFGISYNRRADKTKLEKLGKIYTDIIEKLKAQLLEIRKSPTKTADKVKVTVGSVSTREKLEKSYERVKENLGCTDLELEYLRRIVDSSTAAGKYLSLTDLDYFNKKKDKTSVAINSLQKKLEKYRLEKGKTLIEIIGCDVAEFEKLKTLIAGSYEEVILKLVFGENLVGRKDDKKLNNQNIKRYSKAITVVKRRYIKMATSPEMPITKNVEHYKVGKKDKDSQKKDTLVKENKCSGRSKSKTLTEALSCTIEELHYLRRIAKSKTFTSSILNLTNEEFENLERTKKFFYAINNLKDRLIKYREEKNKTLSEIIGCSYDELLKLTAIHFEKSSTPKLLCSVFGENLDKPKDDSKLDSTNLFRYDYQLTTLKKLYKKLKESINDELECKSYKTIMEKLECNSEDLEFLRRTTNPSKKTIKFLYLSDTDFLLASKDLVSGSLPWDLKRRVSCYKDIKGKTLREIVDCSEEAFEAAKKSYFSEPNTPKNMILVFGENLDQVLDESKLNYENIAHFNRSLTCFKNRAIKEDEKLKESSQLNKQDISGSTDEPEILLPEDHSVIFNINSDFIKGAIKALPIEYKLVLELHLGIYDGRSYPVQDIAVLFNVDEDAIVTRLTKGKLLLENMLEACKKTTQDDLGRMFDGVTLNRSKPKESK